MVIVTGAARGQGEQEVRLFAAEGARVVVANVLDGQGEAPAKELGALYVHLYVHLDVRDEEGWRAAVAPCAAMCWVRTRWAGSRRGPNSTPRPGGTRT